MQGGPQGELQGGGPQGALRGGGLQGGGLQGGELQTRGAGAAEGGMSRDMMVAVGAQVMLEEFVSGSTTARLQKAVTELDEWVSAAQRC